jgi:DNA invertase Pin-like site-specific DNA recombinase
MSDIPSSLIAPIDPDLGGVLLANMLETWLDAYPDDLTTAGVTDELEDYRTASEQPAYIYVRQSTLAQVRHHQESTERQYALRQKALELGWNEATVRTLDRDLGISGAQMTGRTDFKALVADVSMGQVGAVFALEVSRLARSNADWYRLLELCALTQTLVIDEDGCYDPADFNDGLLLGLKGTMAQAELHFLRARLLGGKLNKAKKGELRFPLPVGFCHDDEGRIILDPDEEVRGAVALVFRLFRETGSAYGVVHQLTQRGLLFPKRAYGGAWNGKIVWGRLSHGRVLGMLKNPSYAGMYVFGRYQYRREISPEGEVHKRMQAAAMPAWRVSLKEHHEGYITWEEFFGECRAHGEKPHERRRNAAEGPRARRPGLVARTALVRQLWPRTDRALRRQRRNLSNVSLLLGTP